MLNDNQKAAIIAELTEIEFRVPGALLRMYDAIMNGRIDGSDYIQCALGHAVLGTKVDAESLGAEITEKFYGGDRYGLFLEGLIHAVRPGVTPTHNQKLEELVLLIKGIQA